MSEAVAVPISPEALSEAISSSTPVQSDRSEMVMGDDMMNHLTYKATNNVPYIIDNLGLKEFYQVNPMVTEMAKELHLLLVDNDSEVQIHETKAILESLAQELNFQDNDAPIYKLRKMLNLAKIKDRLATNEKNRMQILAESEIM